MASDNGYGLAIGDELPWKMAQGTTLNFAYLCEDVRRGKTTWAESIAIDMSDGASRQQAKNMHFFARDALCPHVRHGTKPPFLKSSRGGISIAPRGGVVSNDSTVLMAGQTIWWGSPRYPVDCCRCSPGEPGPYRRIPGSRPRAVRVEGDRRGLSAGCSRAADIEQE